MDNVYVVLTCYADVADDDGTVHCETLCLDKIEARNLAHKLKDEFITTHNGGGTGGEDEHGYPKFPINLDDYDVTEDEEGYHVHFGPLAGNESYKNWVASFTVQEINDIRPPVEFRIKDGKFGDAVQPGDPQYYEDKNA